MINDTLDVLIVGAGISGIGAAYFLQRDCPDRTFKIVEARSDLGGTWDLFRYPGVRSDSDMHTLGYSFKPWTGGKALASGPDILAYLKDTADAFDLRDRMAFEHKVVSASWSSTQALWSVTLEVGADAAQQTIECRFLFLCSGYYDYAAGYAPQFAGEGEYEGQTIHPQHWPEDLDYSGKTVVVIGSGATAVTLVPAMAEDAKKVTMLQRTPTYIVSQPSIDVFGMALAKVFPVKAATFLSRWRNILTGMVFFKAARRWPGFIKKQIAKGIVKELGDDPDTLKHFDPPYNPWEQRLCLVPDGDFFTAMRAGKVDIVTETIERFDAAGVCLSSGAHLPADIVVKATGLTLKFLGGARIDVDGRDIRPGQQITYKGVMYAGVPNLATCFGYTNASWTLKSDLAGQYVARLLNKMAAKDAAAAMPTLKDQGVTAETWVDFSSGYFRRAAADIPKQGSKPPWQLHQAYFSDIKQMRFSAVEDDWLQFFSASEMSERTDRSSQRPVAAE